MSSVQSVRESDVLPYVLRDPRSATLNCALVSAAGSGRQQRTRLGTARGRERERAARSGETQERRWIDR